MNRRRLMFLLPVGGLAAAGIALWPEPDLPEGIAAIDAGTAHAEARAGAIWIVDIRRPDEWARTGLPAGAIALDMRREDFATALAGATRSDPARPIALICARGVRSRRLALRLNASGHAPLFDIAEGMLGSAAGPGWLARGLPTDPPPPAART